MTRKIFVLILLGLCSVAGVFAQTTTGLITGIVTDSAGAVVPDATISVVNQDTGSTRDTTSNGEGIYIVPQLAPGNYTLEVSKAGFGKETHSTVQLEVNQSLTLDFKLGVAASTQTVNVTGAAPTLNTTSATLSNVINHDETVELPLNGRQFTQLALLSPGASPVQNGQQGSFVVSLGAGGISPSVDGQRGEQNNFTMDGVLNNQIYTNTWVIAPPPDAIQEFNVQSHITDAQFSISSGANINVVTRAGTNKFHGALWEFLRNDALDARTYPDVQTLPYRQNQYGLYFGGPIWVPKVIDGRNNTWFSLYWEGFRSAQTNTHLASVPTPSMLGGDFSSILGAQTGSDSLGRPVYTNEIFDPLTSRPDPANPGQVLRDPFPGNRVPVGRINPATLQYISHYYPLPNLNVADGVFPNLRFTGANNTASDILGGRIDHQFSQNDNLFVRFNRAKQTLTTPEGLPTYSHYLLNYGQQAALGYTHVFNPQTLLNFRYGYSYINYNDTDEPAGTAFVQSIGAADAYPMHDGVQLAPALGISNGFTGTSQFAVPLGPMEAMDYHLDLSKVVSNHTVGVGGMYYHLRSYDDGWVNNASFTQNATSVNGAAGPSGYGAASLLLGALDSYGPWLGNTGADQTVNWYGAYVQDQWQATKRLVLTAGIRWDYVSPPNYHKIVSGLNALDGQFLVTGAVPPAFPTANAPSGYFQSQYNGWEPRFGLVYQFTPSSVLHGAFAMLDDHNNTLIQENQNLRLSWPSGVAANFTSLDLGVPTTYLNALPDASTILGGVKPYVSYGADPDNKIPYVMEYNLGIQQQLTGTLSMKLDYVGSLGRHQYIVPEANTALFPGPGAIAARQPFPQFGGPFSFSWNQMPSSYNALQAQLQKSMSNGLFFQASYTWSKSLDWQSDPYSNTEPNFYNLHMDWGPSDYNKTHMVVLTEVYQLPFGHGRRYLAKANRLVDGAAGGWLLGSIITLNSGSPFTVYAGGDVANTGSPGQRAELTGADPYGASGFAKNRAHWINTAAFAQPVSYTFGDEGRNGLVGPRYNNFDLNLSKSFPLFEGSSLQFRSEFFNIFNHTNLSNPDTTVTDGAFGQILSAAAAGRQIQFALKVLF